MRIEKKTLNDALRVLGKVVSQTSPVELYHSVRLFYLRCNITPSSGHLVFSLLRFINFFDSLRGYFGHPNYEFGPFSISQ